MINVLVVLLINRFATRVGISLCIDRKQLHAKLLSFSLPIRFIALMGLVFFLFVPGASVLAKSIPIVNNLKFFVANFVILLGGTFVSKS